MEATNNTAHNGPEGSPDIVDAIVDRLRDPERDQSHDDDLLMLGFDILKRRHGLDVRRPA